MKSLRRAIIIWHMRIAQIVNLSERVPPKKYGGTERVVYGLTEELVRRGHQLTLFASGDSETSARLISVYPKNLRESKFDVVYGPSVLNLHNIGLAYQMQDQFDIIHDHTSLLSLPTANIASTPVLITMHGAFSRYETQMLRLLRRPFINTISKMQARFAPGLNIVGNVYNGLNMEHYPFSNQPDSYLLYVGRIAMEKGVHYAVVAAQYLNLPLILAAKVDPVDMPYFKTYIKPNLSNQIRWIGEVDEPTRNRLMSKALAFLHPVTWPEPFGLTLIEAMACGCPVVAFNKGSIPELVVHEKTGFVVSDVEEMVDAVLNIDKIKREDCRSHAIANFNVRKMADGYESLYNKILFKVDKKQALELEDSK